VVEASVTRHWASLPFIRTCASAASASGSAELSWAHWASAGHPRQAKLSTFVANPHGMKSSALRALGAPVGAVAQDSQK
jgi:hypothetical protein